MTDETLKTNQPNSEDAHTTELIDGWSELFKDKESRHIYMNDFLDSSIAAQLRVLREQRDLTQTQLADKAGMTQERISLMESMSYSSWTVSSLRRLAEALDLRLVVRFEEFGGYVEDFLEFDREHLERKSFDQDAVFSENKDRV